jgi:hypothetical protein
VTRFAIHPHSLSAASLPDSACARQFSVISPALAVDRPQQNDPPALAHPARSCRAAHPVRFDVIPSSTHFMLLNISLCHIKGREGPITDSCAATCSAVPKRQTSLAAASRVFHLHSLLSIFAASAIKMGERGCLALLLFHGSPEEAKSLV